MIDPLQPALGGLPGTVYRCRDDSQRTMLALTDPVRTLTGWAPDELVGDGAVDFASMIHPQDRGRVADTIRSAVDRGEPFQVAYRLAPRDGGERWVLEHGWVDEDGPPGVLTGYIQDLSDVPAAEERLAEATRFLERTIESLAEAVMVVGGDDLRTIHEVNRATEEMFGWARDELVGGSAERLHVSSEAFDRFGRDSRRALRALGTYSTSVPMRRRDGTEFAAEQTVSILHPEIGLAGGVVSIVRDVSRRAEVERKLRESEEQFRQIAEHVQDVFWVMSPDGSSVEYVSPAFSRVWGRDPAELLADRRVWRESIHPEDLTRVLEALSRQATDGYDEEYRIVTPDGRVRWIWDRAYPVRDAEGNVKRILGVAGDVTARRELEARLRHAQKMEAVGRLAGGVAHDFNNLLTVIVGQADLLLLDLPEGSVHADEVALIRAAAERGAGLTRQLLAFSREQLLRPRMVDASEVLAGIQRLLSGLLREDIRLDMRLPQGLPPVQVDPGQLEQVMLNLAANARDAMPDGGSVAFTTSLEQVGPRDAVRYPGLKPGEYVTITVADTGIGMDEKTRGRAFEPFFTTRKDNGGTGLGLATCYGIVKQSGGTIHVDSTPGRGATFRVRFPPAEAAVDEPRAQAPTS